MSITLTTPVTFDGATETTVAAVDSRIDFLNGIASATQCYGNGSGAAFVPSVNLPGKNVTISLITGAVWVNGVPLMNGGNPVTITAADLQNIVSTMVTAQNAYDQALINAGLFVGTVS